MLRNTQSQWGSVAKVFHWVVAALILVEFFLGWIAVSLALSPAKLNVFVWHKSIGFLTLLLVTLRLLWRWANPVPRLPVSMPHWQHIASTADHLVQYVITFAVPMSGWIVDSTANIPFRVLWVLPLPRLTGPNEALEKVAKDAHLALSVGLAVLLVGHIGAALWHHFIVRDDVLHRMLPKAMYKK